MTSVLLQISVDWVLIVRCLLALFWGIVWALFIQFTNQGKFLVKERTWITVVIGIGVDLLIDFGGNYFNTVAVIAFSSIGIIGRSLINESREPAKRGYRSDWSLDDAESYALKLFYLLPELLGLDDINEVKVGIAQGMRYTHSVLDWIRQARVGTHDLNLTNTKTELKTNPRRTARNGND